MKVDANKFLIAFLCFCNLIFLIKSFSIRNKGRKYYGTNFGVLKQNITLYFEKTDDYHIYTIEANNISSYIKEEDFRIEHNTDTISIRAWPGGYLTTNYTQHNRPFFNTHIFFDKDIHMLVSAFRKGFIPVYKLTKIRTNQNFHQYSDWEIIIKVPTSELRTYKEIIVSEDRFFKDDIENMKVFPESEKIKIRKYNGYNVISEIERSPYDSLAIENNKKEFDKFVIVE